MDFPRPKAGRFAAHSMKKLLRFVFAFLMSFCLMTTAFSAAGTRTGQVDGGDAGNTAVSDSDKNTGGVNFSDPGATNAYINNELADIIAPDVTTDTIVGKLESKGNDIVHILQTVGKYVCIGMFVICCILIPVGIIGNKKILTGAVIGLVISGLAYAGIVCGREIVNFIAAWATS